MARKSRYAAGDNAGRVHNIPLIRYARQPMFLRGVRDMFLGRNITVEQSMYSGRDQCVYYDGRQFAAMFPHITVPEIRKGREDDVLPHVERALQLWRQNSYVEPGHGGRVFQQWLEEQAAAGDRNT